MVDINKKRVSLANLVNTQLELKRQSIPQKSFKRHSQNSKNQLNKSTCSVPYDGSRSVSFDLHNKNFKDNKRFSQFSERQDQGSKDLFSFLTSTSTLTPKSQIICQAKDNYLSDSKWSFDNGKDTDTYGSVINRMAEAVGDSETLFEYLKKALNILYHTTCAKFFTTSLVLLHLVQIIIGLKNLNDCPIQQRIPVYLFVGGCVGLLKSIHLIWNQLKISNNSQISSGDHSIGPSSGIDDNEILDNEERNFSKGSKFTDRLLSIFLAIWFGFGNYWILSIHEPRYEPLLLEPDNWCDKNLYIFALVHLLIYYVLIALALIFIFFLTIFTQTPCLIKKFQDC